MSPCLAVEVFRSLVHRHLLRIQEEVGAGFRPICQKEGEVVVAAVGVTEGLHQLRSRRGGEGEVVQVGWFVEVGAVQVGEEVRAG